MPGCTPWRMPTWPALVIEGARASYLPRRCVPSAEPVVEEGHVAGAQRVTQDGLGEAVDLEDDEAGAGTVVDIAADAGHALHGVAEEGLVLVETDDGHEHGADGGDEDRGDEGHDEAIDLDAVDEPAGRRAGSGP